MTSQRPLTRLPEWTALDAYRAGLPAHEEPRLGHDSSTNALIRRVRDTLR